LLDSIEEEEKLRDPVYSPVISPLPRARRELTRRLQLEEVSG
jgi:hypothetical protein